MNQAWDHHCYWCRRWSLAGLRGVWTALWGCTGTQLHSEKNALRALPRHQCVCSRNARLQPVRQGVLLSPRYRWENRGPGSRTAG